MIPSAAHPQTVDYLVIGQGLSGTLLSWNLMAAGKKVVVIDTPKPFTASKVASGVINPITGRRLVRTWRIEALLPFAKTTYEQIGGELGHNIYRPIQIIDFFATDQMKQQFDLRQPTEPYLSVPANTQQWNSLFHFNFGAGQIESCGLVDLQALLAGWRTILQQQNSLVEEQFSWQDCAVSSNGVQYKHISAGTIVCCEGVEGFTNPYFRNLPYTNMKGEVLIAQIPGLPRNTIYKLGFTIVPWKDDLFWIGSSYEWSFNSLEPTAAFRQKVEEQLKWWLKVPFEIVDHFAANRPGNVERRPFVGVHPVHRRVAILNGMGAKGCSLAPFFAHQLTHHLLYGSTIYPDADVRRFEKSLQRTMD